MRGPSSELSVALADYAPDLLIADMFWAPLRHILPLLNTEVWLLVRSCPDIWLRGTETTPFDSSQFTRIIGIEPLTHEEIREHIAPIVICNPDGSMGLFCITGHFLRAILPFWQEAFDKKGARHNYNQENKCCN